MKKSLIFLLIANSSISFAQADFNIEQLADKWTQGKIDSIGKVVQADVSLGGWYHLNIYEDGSMVFASPFTCGFGRQREGKWTLNMQDTTITFFLKKEKGYMNNPGIKDIEETEIYKIGMLNEEALILRLINSENERIYPFIKTENVK